MIKDIFKNFRPQPTYPNYPPYHNGLYLEDYFYSFYYENNCQTERIYIPVSWTTCYIEEKTHGLQNVLDSLDPNLSYFTISQHDDAIKEKLPSDTMRFCAGGNKGGIPIPLICSPIPVADIQQHKLFYPEKDLVCSFIGSLTHPLRQQMVKDFNNKPNTIVQGSSWSINVTGNRYHKYIETAVRSKFLLCPRGYGLNSFRLYESFQLGCVPVIITDKIFLPWQNHINWESFSIITNNTKTLYEKLISVTDETYNSMLNNGIQIYQKYFTLEKMCLQILNDLEENLKLRIDKPDN